MRLRRPEEFRRVRSEGRSWAHPLFVVWRAPNLLDHSRVGITASRKLGCAVERNRARRLLREGMRHLYAHIASGWDIVLVGRSGLLSAKEAQVEIALRLVLTRANLVSPPESGCDAGV
ncbi:MAG: ribonuclease P protein component [Anaerolineae bacterium]|nr:ribonuclease P protein component [Anaerolineae bacterium]